MPLLMESSLMNNDLSKHVAAMLIKPDAVDLDITEFLIEHVAGLMKQRCNAELEGVHVIESLKEQDIAILYPSLDRDGIEIVRSYLSSGLSVLVTFRGDGTKDLWSGLKQIKGPRMIDWDEEELSGSLGINNFVRAMIPVPGTLGEYEPVLEKIRLKKSDPSARFTDKEFRVYCRNLIHTPDNRQELLGLLSLLDKTSLRTTLGSDIVEALANRNNYSEI